MRRAVTQGVPNTAMQSFANVLSRVDIEAVVDFVRDEFIAAKRQNSRYHTEENGWPNHGRYEAVFAFVTGDITIDTPIEDLSPAQAQARTIYLNSCIVCHEAREKKPSAIDWRARAISYPRGGVTPQNLDAISSATPYSKHQREPSVAALSPLEQQGEPLFKQNCAFCHAPDGTGGNWIGRFIEPPPQDLTDEKLLSWSMDEIKTKIAEGVPGTAMPAWKTVFTREQIDAVAAYVKKAFVQTKPKR